MTSKEPSNREKSTVFSIENPNQKVLINNRKGYLISKRVTDVICSLLSLIVLTPIFFIIVLLIRIEDRNCPAIFKQIRIGQDGKPFYMYKFRSMVTNAETLKVYLLHQNEATGPVFKMKDDPRVTKVGRFLRKTSLDELPQLLNVLKGEMSLVGPRPPLQEEVKQYTSYERQRLNVTPGLTCYWQVSGRSNLGFEQWMDLDMKYIRERNYLVDSKLIIKTIFVLFGSKDAY
ncbi:sugar transferase [Solibacillus sp. FSL K6-1523]|uniref:sugar transferase n=1 Tax=Solibacillus sp. FSL K6-1523 TaxID=2921471 RepID=UPI004046C759